MRSYKDVITPARASELLSTVTGNRSLNQKYVSTLAADMASGAWKLTPQGIIIDEAGQVLDGQHRLSAVVRSGVSVTFWVTEGFSRENFSCLDTGMQRGMKDVLKISGYPDPSQLAGVARKAWCWEHRMPVTQKRRCTVAELDDVLARYPQLKDAAAYAHGWRGKPAPVTAAFAWWLLSQADPGDATGYMEGIRTGVSLQERSGVLAARDRLLQAARPGMKAAKSSALAILIVGWNHYRSGTEISRIVIPNPLSNDSFPVPDGDMLLGSAPGGDLASSRHLPGRGTRPAPRTA